ncbi:TraB/GumN family protein [Chitinophaga lutea]|uniref:TraB/GumN family protein n=1 Tax=Chitinophaga lutea TaxID=2488634 RepID=A0A3N4PL87_9BACT|nr:TraB/GumN family protein [Chitinophaga lutea]RPE05621.1 TraB/GumN family protein [Chitinophaga lutea]
MRKSILLTLLLALTLIPALAQQSLLYRISGKGLQQPAYLYGTIHLICAGDFVMPPALKNAVAASTALYLEIDLDDPSTISEMVKGMAAPEGYSLQQHFTPEDFARLTAWLKDSMQLDINQFARSKPMVLQMKMLQRAVPCSDPVSYEIELLKIAMAGKKPVMGLERIGDQIAVFDSIPDSVECRMIMDYVNDFPKQRATFEQMTAAYKRQDAAALHRLFAQSAEWAGYEDALVYDRNRNWVPVIEKAIRQGPVVIACGAMHLGGEQGLLALLKARGYEVTPVRE